MHLQTEIILLLLAERNRCVQYYMIGLFKQTTDSIIITGNYADSNFIVNTNLNGCVDGPNKSNNFNFKVFDSRGRLVFSQKGSANMLIPDKFKSGIYYLSVTDNNGVMLQRQFVVNR